MQRERGTTQKALQQNLREKEEEMAAAARTTPPTPSPTQKPTLPPVDLEPLLNALENKNLDKANKICREGECQKLLEEKGKAKLIGEQKPNFSPRQRPKRPLFFG